jgi:protoporphyrinogen oxidase
LSNYLSKDHHLYSKNINELLEIYIPAIQKINPHFEESWIKEANYFRIEAAQPIITKNYSQLIPSHRTPIQNLYLANTTQIYPEDRGTNYSVRLGRKIAQMVLEDNNHKIIDNLPTPIIPNSFTNSKNF